MKIEIEENKKDGTYPCIMKRIGFDTIVWFIEERKGFIIDSPHDCGYGSGYYDEWEMSEFEPFHGKITIEQ